MEPQFALVLDNLIPYPAEVRLRKGRARFLTFAESNAVESMYVHGDVTGVQRLLATTKIGGSGVIFNATPGDAGGGEVSLRGSLNADCRWSWTTLDGITVGVNGFDQPVKYTIAGGISDTTFTHASLTNDNLLAHVNNFRGRLYLVEKDTSNVYYTSDGGIAGALTQAAMGKLFARGGNVLFTTTWSGETGKGIDDLLLVASSNGELLAFSGAFPGDSAWTLVGRFNLGDFLSRNAYFKVGGDTYLLTQSGLYPFSKIFGLGDGANYLVANLADKITPTWTASATNFIGDWRWTGIEVPSEDWFIINVPISSSRVDQFVMHNKTGAWARFAGWNAYSWAKLGNFLYYGGVNGLGNIWEANNGYDDDGEAIKWKIQTAFNSLGDPSLHKRFLEVNPVFTSSGVSQVTLGSSVNSDLVNVTKYQIPVDADPGFIYGVSVYGVDAFGNASTVFDNNYGLVGSGFNISMLMEGSTNSLEFALTSFRCMYTAGGVR
jgi:hypothetical protein